MKEDQKHQFFSIVIKSACMFHLLTFRVQRMFKHMCVVNESWISSAVAFVEVSKFHSLVII